MAITQEQMIAQMMLDLGFSRFDTLSAPDADSRGRLNAGSRQRANGGNRLPDRRPDRGHHRNHARNASGNDNQELLINQVGEERALYLSQHPQTAKHPRRCKTPQRKAKRQRAHDNASDSKTTAAGKVPASSSAPGASKEPAVAGNGPKPKAGSSEPKKPAVSAADNVGKKPSDHAKRTYSRFRPTPASKRITAAIARESIESSNRINTIIAGRSTPAIGQVNADIAGPSTPVSDEATTTVAGPSSPISNEAATVLAESSTPVSDEATTTVAGPSSPISNEAATVLAEPPTLVSDEATTIVAGSPSPISNEVVVVLAEPPTLVSDEATTIVAGSPSPISTEAVVVLAEPATPVSNEAVIVLAEPATPVSTQVSSANTASPAALPAVSQSTSERPFDAAQSSATESADPSMKAESSNEQLPPIADQPEVDRSKWLTFDRLIDARSIGMTGEEILATAGQVFGPYDVKWLGSHVHLHGAFHRFGRLLREEIMEIAMHPDETRKTHFFEQFCFLQNLELHLEGAERAVRFVKGNPPEERAYPERGHFFPFYIMARKMIARSAEGKTAKYHYVTGSDPIILGIDRPRQGGRPDGLVAIPIEFFSSLARADLKHGGIFKKNGVYYGKPEWNRQK